MSFFREHQLLLRMSEISPLAKHQLLSVCYIQYTMDGNFEEYCEHVSVVLSGEEYDIDVITFMLHNIMKLAIANQNNYDILEFLVQKL